MEINFNKIFSLYAKNYYNAPITSVYLWDLGDKTIEDGFAVAIVIKNSNLLRLKISRNTSEGYKRGLLGFKSFMYCKIQW